MGQLIAIVRRSLLALVPSRIWMRTAWERRARENAEHYVADFRDEWTSMDEFFASGRQDVEKFLSATDWGTTTNALLLEIGCGVGRMTRYFAEKFAHVDAIDVSPTMIRKAQESQKVAPNVTFHVGSGVDLRAFPDNSFDYVISYIVFQHIPRAKVIYGYVHEALRVLKPDGRLRFQARNDASPHHINAYNGASIDIAEIRKIAEHHKRKVISVEGTGTQYCYIEIA